jgi:hypothetical protein
MIERINKMCSTISREEIEDNKSSQDITKSVNVDKYNEKKRISADYSAKMTNDSNEAGKTSLSDETLSDRYFNFFNSKSV